MGRGKQLAWLAYEERSRPVLSLKPPDSPIGVGHPQLQANRALKLEELEAFTVEVATDAAGPLVAERGSNEATYISSLLQSLDSRLERISYQQYVRIAVVRRDATYELCGTRGVLVLSGDELRGAATRAALRPIKRRLMIWAAGSIVLLLAAISIKGGLLGATAYFVRSDAWIAYTTWAALALAILVLGGCLREVRPGFRFGRLRGTEIIAGACACALVACAVAVSFLARPTVGEVHRALAAGDVSRARRVVEALSVKAGRTKEISEADDVVVLAEADKSPVSQALVLLDGVARGGGSRAGEAASKSRAHRLAEIAGRIREKAGANAINLIDNWFPETWKADAEVAELRAQAEEVEGAKCTTVACQFGAARRASRAVTTPARVQRTESSRRDLLAALTFKEQPAEPILTKLQRLRALSVVAGEAREIAADDVELVASATKMMGTAAEQRARTPLLGAGEGVLGELVSPFSQRYAKISAAVLDGVSIYAHFDKQRNCRGLYAVGPSEGYRGIASSVWSAERILSQALGRAAVLRTPVPSTATVSRWAEAGVPVVARWRGGSIIELRIGDAAP